jgi:diguanylate cyclase (GGDEF)-like protein
MVVLGLREGADPKATAMVREILDQALALIRDLLPEGGFDRQSLMTRIDTCRTALMGGADPELVDRLIHECLNLGREAAAIAEAQRAERRREIATIVDLVRDAIAAAVGHSEGMNGSLHESTARFESLAAIDDLRELKTKLASEVLALKRMIAERQKAWETTVTAFKARMTELEDQILEHQQDAAIDPLTQVGNRRAFDRQCHQWASSSRLQFVVALFDVDNFKSINDTYGHQPGDQVLIAAAQAIKAHTRANDLLARFGGDEFVLLAANLTLKQAETRLMSIVAKLAVEEFHGPDGRSFRMTASCGVTEFAAGDTVQSLVRRADEALYKAKRQGKNRVVAVARPYVRDLMKR